MDIFLFHVVCIHSSSEKVSPFSCTNQSFSHIQALLLRVPIKGQVQGQLPHMPSMVVLQIFEKVDAGEGSERR